MRSLSECSSESNSKREWHKIWFLSQCPRMNGKKKKRSLRVNDGKRSICSRTEIRWAVSRWRTNDIFTTHAPVQKHDPRVRFFHKFVLILHNSGGKKHCSLPSSRQFPAVNPAQSGSVIFFTRTVRSMHIFVQHSILTLPTLVFVDEA
jgi:hypothetical protein